jgi:hypothetical protein
MKKDIWGPYIWSVLHCLSLRIKPEYFQKERTTLINFILEICDNLPCPSCANHATYTLKRLNFKNVRTKEDLVNCIFTLHNEANKRLKKKQFEKKLLEDTYKTHNLQSLLIGYFNLNYKIKFAEKMMIYSSRRRLFLNRFLDYCKNNMDKFDVIIEDTSIKS